MKKIILIATSLVIILGSIIYLLPNNLTVDELQLIDKHTNVTEEYNFSTLSGFKILDESTILVTLNNSNNNAYFSGGEQIESNVELFVFEKIYEIDDMFIISARQHEDVILQIFKLGSIDIKNRTATFPHYVSHIPFTDNLKQVDYVGKKVIVS